MIVKLCTYPGCDRLTKSGNYCEVHRKLSDEKKKEREKKLFTKRTSSAPYNHLYRTAAWRALRSEFLKRFPRCFKCGAKATIADHITPHKGNLDLFFNMDNLQPMCQSCHSAKTLAENNYFKRNR